MPKPWRQVLPEHFEQALKRVILAYIRVWGLGDVKMSWDWVMQKELEIVRGIVIMDLYGS